MLTNLRNCCLHVGVLLLLIRSILNGNYCPNPGTPINGIKSRTTYNMGDSVYFACQPEHVLIGSEVRECMPDRTWSGTETKCLGSYDYTTYKRDRNTLKGFFTKRDKQKEQNLKESRLTIDERRRNCRSNSHPGRLVIYFAFDVSRSIGEQNFKKSVEFAKAIVTKVGISPNGTLAYAFTFGSETKIVFTPEYHDTTERVLKSLDNLKHTGGRSSKESALELLNELIEGTRAFYGDYSLTFVVFILSNGEDTIYSFPKMEAEKLKKSEGVEIYCIGITEDVSLTPLRNIASHPKEKHIFNIKSYPIMAWLVADITKESLGSYVSNVYPRGRITLENNLNQERRKGDRIILCFAFDDSRNTGEHHFKKSIQFAKAMVKKVGISRDGNLAGALTFGSKSKISLMPVEYDTTKEVIKKLDNLNYTGGELSTSPFIDIGLMMSVTALIYSATSNLIPVIFILSNGLENLDISTKNAIYNYKHKLNAEIYCIGVTNDASNASLYYMASDPTNEHVYILDNYPTMSWLIQYITDGKRDYSQCGLGHENIHSLRIVGGRNVTEPWPWMAALYFIVDGSPKLQCGGSIIHESYILTAAHCVFDRHSRLRQPSDIIVKLGLTDVKNETFLQVSEVIRVISHPRYRDGFYDFDIALLHLKHPIMFNAYIRPICLPPFELEQGSALYNATKFGVTTGWGHEEILPPRARQRIKVTEQLKEITLPIQTRMKCIMGLTEYGVSPTSFTKNMFCAGDGRKGNDTCYGDSGSPFMQWLRNSDGDLYWTQTGIVSWGIGCGLANTYGYYTHVQRLRLWIDEVM